MRLAKLRGSLLILAAGVFAALIVVTVVKPAAKLAEPLPTITSPFQVACDHWTKIGSPVGPSFMPCAVLDLDTGHRFVVVVGGHDSIAIMRSDLDSSNVSPKRDEDDDDFPPDAPFQIARDGNLRVAKPVQH